MYVCTAMTCPFTQAHQCARNTRETASAAGHVSFYISCGSGSWLSWNVLGDMYVCMYVHHSSLTAAVRRTPTLGNRAVRDLSGSSLGNEFRLLDLGSRGTDNH